MLDSDWLTDIVFLPLFIICSHFQLFVTEMSSVLFTFMMIFFVLSGDVFLLCVSIRCSDLFPDPRTDVGWGYRWHQIHVLSKGKNKGFDKEIYLNAKWHYFNLLIYHCLRYHILFLQFQTHEISPID